MPVCLDPNYPNYPSYGKTTLTKMLSDRPPTAFHEWSSKCITIGLVNNMPDGALEATERQFLSLLNSSSEDMLVRVSFHALPNVPRSEAGAHHVNNYYSSTENLSGKSFDGLIVTGREPLTPNLTDEPYWHSLRNVLEWAKNNTHSTIWSCLAAHAAVLHMDGIDRIRSNDKHSGVFECDRVSNHPLIADAPSSVKLPHSRWNGLSEDALVSCGYSVLTRSSDAGVDTFVKQYKSLFVFFQGHPEYETNTLLLEYRRDIGRYFRGETNSYPLMPRNYFDRETAIKLTALQNAASSDRRKDLLAEISTALEMTRIRSTWHSTSTRIYRNWLEYICAQKELRLKEKSLPSQHTHSPAPLLQRISF
jgi:homoserine O-succinyltransferase/O-acetyltransferase